MAILFKQICDTLYIAFTIPSEEISLSDLLHSSNVPGQIYSDMDAIFIEDATSQICVNDNKILIHQLKEGDIIRINGKLLTFSREKITFSSSYENKWLCVRDVWSRSNNISIGGRGATGEIELDSLCISCIFENYRDFPEEYLYEGLMDKSIIVAGYSLLILLYRNSSVLSNSDEWQKPREGILSYSHGCTSWGYRWNEFIQIAKQEIIPSFRVYRGYLQRCSIPEYSKILHRFIEDWQNRNIYMWQNHGKSYAVLWEDDCEPQSLRQEKDKDYLKGMRYSAELLSSLRCIFDEKIRMNPFFYYRV